MSGSSGDATKRTDGDSGMASRRSKRARVVYRDFDIAESWDAFAAEEQVGDHEDHTAQCRAVIFVDGTDVATDADGYEGQTGNGHGHAEMDAIDFALQQLGDETMDEALRAGGVTLDCVGKPCCVQCSTMLGLLNIGPRTPATHKSRHTMLAGGAWSVSLRLKTFLKEKWHLKEADIEAFAATDQAGFDRAL